MSAKHSVLLGRQFDAEGMAGKAFNLQSKNRTSPTMFCFQIPAHVVGFDGFYIVLDSIKVPRSRVNSRFLYPLSGVGIRLMRGPCLAQAPWVRDFAIFDIFLNLLTKLAVLRTVRVSKITTHRMLSLSRARNFKHSGVSFNELAISRPRLNDIADQVSSVHAVRILGRVS